MRRNRYRNRTGQKKMPLWGILVICFGAAFLIFLVVGLILNATLDEETYYRLTTKPRNNQEDTILFVPSIPDVIAAPYRFGGDLSDLGGASAVSLALNRSEGGYLYRSEVLDYFQKGKTDGEELSVELARLVGSRLYVSGIFYPGTLSETSSSKKIAKEAEETAVLREFFACGGGDVILCGLDLIGNTDAAIDYVKAVKLAVGQEPVGVALPYECLLSENSGKLLERILTVADFVAMDLSGIETDKPLDELLGATKYSYTQYHLRLLFSQKETSLIEAARSIGIGNYEILY